MAEVVLSHHGNFLWHIEIGYVRHGSDMKNLKSLMSLL